MKLANNTTSLQNILETVNSLPEAGENLDSELSTQDSLIAAIMTALEGKSVGNGKKTVSVTIDCTLGGNVSYHDADGRYTTVFVRDSRTVEVLGGIIERTYGVIAEITGDYVQDTVNGTTYVFFSDGGLIRVAGYGAND